MEFEASNFQFSIDLETTALYQLQFLKLVDTIPKLKSASCLARSVYRYEKYWLPLAADHPHECMSAPVDIEWVWHCHMLSPRAYNKDCTTVVNAVVNHRLKELDEYTRSMDRSKELWDRRYGDEEPFNVHFDLPFDEQRLGQFQSNISYNIVKAAMRQKDFLYQVSLPHYKDEKYLQGALLRYKKFLFMKQQLPGEFIVPCYDIDLIWHTHQLHPLEYRADMVKYLGQLFNHDDTTTDRSEGSKLNRADKQTRKHWKNIFKDSFSRFGAMYRGKPPEGVLDKIKPDDLNPFTTETGMVQVHFEAMALQFQGSRRYKRFTLNIGTRNQKGATVLTFKRPPNTPHDASEIIWSKQAIGNTGSFFFDTKYSNELEIVLLETVYNTFRCCGFSTNKIAETVYPFQAFVKSCGPGGDTFDLDIQISRNITLKIHGMLDPPEKGPVVLTLEKGVFETATIPENIQTLWGPVSLERLPVGKDNHCKVATHCLKSKSGMTAFTCRTIHSVPLMISVIQVFFKDKMAAIGHLIASDQLPLPTQVKGLGITLNPRAGERAVLIKNHSGDWGIVTGRWTGFKKGIPGIKGYRYKKGVPGKPGSPGTLKLCFNKFNTGQMSTQTLGYLNSDYKFKTETCKADLMNGFIEVLPQSNEVAENLVLAFSVALLHVLCVPRQPGWKEGQPLKPPETLRGSRLIRIIPSDNMDFVLAAGLLWSTPSNYYIHSHYGIKACAMCGGGGCGGEEGEGGVGEGNKDTETDYIGDFSEEYLHLEAGEDGGYTGACNDETGEGGEMGGCGGCGGCGAACYGSTSGGGGDGGGHADSGGGGFGDGGYTGGWDHGSVGGGSVGGGSTGGGSCGGGCGGGCGGD